MFRVFFFVIFYHLKTGHCLLSHHSNLLYSRRKMLTNLLYFYYFMKRNKDMITLHFIFIFISFGNIDLQGVFTALYINSHPFKSYFIRYYF